MKTQKQKFLRLFSHRKLKGVIAGGTVLLGLATFQSWGEGSGSSDFNLSISPSGNNYDLTWNFPYVVLQSSQTLSGDWMDLPEATSPRTVPGNLDKSFFRLRKISAIFAVEPAFLPTSGGTIYVRGVNFDANSTVNINGVPAGSVTFVDSSLLMVNVAAMGAGNYDVAVSNGASGPAGFTLAKSLTVETTPTESLEVPPGMAEGRTASGEINLTRVDLRIDSPVGPDLVVARTHRSRHDAAGSPFDTAWDFSCNISVAMDGADVVVNDGSGRSDKFFRQPNGTFRRAEFFREGSESASTFTLTFADKGRWVFRPFNAATAPGKIAQSIDRNGNTMTYDYNGSGQLTSVTDALNRAIQFAYNGSGQLTGVTDFAGRTVTYAYYGASEPGGSEGDLKSMTSPAVTGTPNSNDFPLGKTVTYTYTKGFPDERLNHNLTGIIDNTGVQVQTIAYTTELNPAHFDFDRAVSVALGANTATVFSCEALSPSPANRYAKTKVTVNDPVGNVSETLYDSKNRPVSIKEMTGRATPGSPVSAVGNQPTGKLRADDPAYFETTMAYNVDSQVIQITYPRGNSVAMTYASDLSSATPVRERGNLRQVTQTPAPDVPSDQAQITEKFEYQPGFGTDEGANQVRVHPSAIIRGLPFSVPASSITKYTDPRGNVTTGTYDGNGNCLSLAPPGLATGHNFEYNAVGQLTAQVSPADANARRQRDTFSYYGSGAQQGYLQNAVADANGLALTTTYTHDSVGNVTNVVDPRGNDSQFVYNQLNELMQVKSAPGGGGVRTETAFTYDAGYKYKPPYSNENNVVNIMFPDSCENVPGSRIIRKEVSNFDENGNPIGEGQLTTSYGRDAIGRLTSVTNEVSDAISTVTQYAYDANGQVTSVLSPLAVSGADAFNTVATSYDERGLPFQQTAAPGSTAQSATQYDYDANANLAAISEGLEGTPRTTTVVANGFATSARSGVYIHGSASFPVSGGTGPITGSGPSGSADLAMAAVARTTVRYYPDTNNPKIAGGVKARRNQESDTLDIARKTSLQSAGKAKLPWIKSTDYGSAADLAIAGGPITTSGPSRSAAELRAQPSGLWVEKLISQNRNAISEPGRGDVVVMDNYGNVEHGDNTPRGSFGRDASPRPTGVLQASILGAASTRGILPNKFLVGVRVCNTHTSRPRSITDPLGNITTFHYDANGNCSSVRKDGEANDVPGSAGNVKLAEASFNYDALNRLTGQTNQLLEGSGNTTGSGSVTASTALADNGATTTVTDALGRVTTVAHDFAGRVSSVTDPKNNSVAYSYDANGNVLTTTRSSKSDLGNADLVFVTSHAYDNLNRCTSTTDNVGNTVSSAYDSRGNVVRSTDARGIVSQYQYDGLSRLTRCGRDMNNNGSTLDPVDIFTTQSWDANSRLATQTDPNGNTASYAYDSLNRLVLTTSADGTIHSATYDIHGNTVSTTDPNGTVVTNAYDSNNRLLQRSITPAVGVATTTTLETHAYDGMGRITQANNNASSLAFTYDSLGRTLTETQDGRTVTSSYDAAGNRLTVVYPGGRTIGYSYDAANLPTHVTLLASSDGDTSGILSTTYYIGGLPERVDKRNQTRTSYSYNGASGASNAAGDYGWGQVSRVLTVHSVSNAVIDDINYSYNPAQNQKGKISTFPGKVTAKAYQYDAGDRLVNTVVTINSVETANITYTLDKAGNRLSVSGDNHPGNYAMDDGLPNPADAQVNQYTSTPVGSFTYDQNGNRLSEAVGGLVTKTYAYDFKNQLVALLDASAKPLATYTYDAVGRRTQKNVINGAVTTTTGFVYDGGGVIEERNGAGGVVGTLTQDCPDIRVSLNALDYNCGDRVSRVNVGAQTVPLKNLGGLLRRGGTNYWPHTDADGSTVALTLDNGTVAERYEYADFGEPAFLDGADNSIPGSVVGNPILWGGMRYDDESGLHNDDGGGYLDPKVGRAYGAACGWKPKCMFN